MTRLFVTLYILISITAFGFLFGINPAINMSLTGVSADLNFKNFRGTVFLLDQYLQESISKEKALAELNLLFGYEVNLIHEDNSELNDKEKAIIKKYGAIEKSIEKNFSNTGYTFLPSNVETSYLWRLQQEPTEAEINHDIAIGTVKLIEQYLAPYPLPLWPEKLALLAPQFGLPTWLIDINHDEVVKLDKNQQQQLNQQLLVSVRLSEREEMFYYRLKGSPYILKAIPVSEPEFIYWLLPIVSIILAGLLALTIYIWIYPLWKYLFGLKKACISFGKGNFSARATTGKFSPINHISVIFNSMAEQVQALIASHKELTNAVSHELRTPLASMRFSLEMLSSTDNNDDRQRYINEISVDIEELDSLVSELLTYARFERSQPDFTPEKTAVLPWISQQINRAQKLSKTKNITLSTHDIDSDSEYLFEEKLMSRALSNLLQNALKYADQSIAVSIMLIESNLKIIVDDDGPGIPPEKRTDIFSPFNRADESRDRKTGGFGIGLAIVKQVIDWHHGNIAIEDSPTGGARFIIIL